MVPRCFSARTGGGSWWCLPKFPGSLSPIIWFSDIQRKTGKGCRFQVWKVLEKSLLKKNLSSRAFDGKKQIEKQKHCLLIYSNAVCTPTILPACVGCSDEFSICWWDPRGWLLRGSLSVHTPPDPTQTAQEKVAYAPF